MTKRPHIKEKASDARARGIEVPPGVPDDAVWATQAFNSVEGQFRWIWFRVQPYDNDITKILGDLLK